MTGLDVFRKLMNLDLILQDSDKMIALHSFLVSVSDDHSSLAKLAAEIDTFTKRIEGLVAAAEKGMVR